jgi:hypothetical protein
VATQRLTVAALGGQTARAAACRFQQWRAAADPEAVDRVCAAIRANALSLPVVYFAEWVDHWLMGDAVPGPGAVEGRQFQAANLTSEQARAWAGQCGSQFPEQEWLACRLREAVAVTGSASGQATVVVIREVVGPSATDEEMQHTLEAPAGWLSSLG